MIKTLFSFAAILMTLNTFAQAGYEVSKDEKNGEVVYRGQVTFKDLFFEPSFSWMKSKSDKYKPDQNTINYLRVHLPAYKLVVFMGTWCSDTHDMVPVLNKVLVESAYPMEKLQMFGVDREKTSRNGETLIYSIVNVPTIIVIDDSREVGRIVETTKKSVEGDLMKMIAQHEAKKTNKMYKP